MDDCRCTLALDFGGRPWIQWDAEFHREKIGEMPTEMFFHFFKSLSDAARMNLVVIARGDNEHHKIEGIFKAFARALKMAVRRDVFRASLAMQERVKSTPNIEILWNCSTKEILGDDNGVTGARIERKDGTVFDIAEDGFFLAIGHHPNSDVFKEYVRTDDNGYILTAGESCATNVEGVFAAGDVRDPRYRQAITAAASGCKAALEVEKYLM